MGIRTTVQPRQAAILRQQTKSGVRPFDSWTNYLGSLPPHAQCFSAFSCSARSFIPLSTNQGVAPGGAKTVLTIVQQS